MTTPTPIAALPCPDPCLRERRDREGTWGDFGLGPGSRGGAAGAQQVGVPGAETRWGGGAQGRGPGPPPAGRRGTCRRMLGWHFQGTEERQPMLGRAPLAHPASVDTPHAPATHTSETGRSGRLVAARL